MTKRFPSRRPILKVCHFFKKRISERNIFQNILSKILLGQSKLCLTPEGIKKGKSTGDMYVALIEKQQKRYSIKTVSLRYQAKRKTVTFTFFKGPNSAPPESLRKSITLPFKSGQHLLPIRKKVKEWFTTPLPPFFEIKINFEVSGCKYSNVFFKHSIGVVTANEIVADISSKHPALFGKKLQRVSEILEVLHCRVISMEEDKQVSTTGEMLKSEICNQLQHSILPEYKISSELSRYFGDLRGIWDSIVSSFKKLWEPSEVALNKSVAK
jgi:hypothetical protein